MIAFQWYKMRAEENRIVRIRFTKKKIEKANSQIKAFQKIQINELFYEKTLYWEFAYSESSCKSDSFISG